MIFGAPPNVTKALTMSTQLPKTVKEYDYTGAMYFTVAVVLVYGLSIVALIATHMRGGGQEDKNESRQVSRYIQTQEQMRRKAEQDRLLWWQNKLGFKQELTGVNREYLPLTPSQDEGMHQKRDLRLHQKSGAPNFSPEEETSDVCVTKANGCRVYYPQNNSSDSLVFGDNFNSLKSVDPLLFKEVTCQRVSVDTEPDDQGGVHCPDDRLYPADPCDTVSVSETPHDLEVRPSDISVHTELASGQSSHSSSYTVQNISQTCPTIIGTVTDDHSSPNCEAIWILREDVKC